MLSNATEVRCDCNRLMMVLASEFTGAVSTTCARCKARLTYPSAGVAVPDERLTCSCGKWLAIGVIHSGYVQMACPRDRALARITRTGTTLIEASRRPAKPPRLPATPQQRMQPPSTDDLVAIIEERWELLRFDRARRSTEVAVGLRFDVFNRDGFRCVYCGRGPDQGVMLEADHRVARSRGGPDTLANLVTACWDCNRGKRDKVLAS